MPTSRLFATFERKCHRAQIAGYYLFWTSMLPFSYSLWSAAGWAHALVATFLWVNTTWNLAVAAVVDPGTVEPDPSDQHANSSNRKHRSTEARRASGPADSSYCRVCHVRAPLPALLDACIMPARRGVALSSVSVPSRSPVHRRNTPRCRGQYYFGFISFHSMHARCCADMGQAARSSLPADRRLHWRQ